MCMLIIQKDILILGEGPTQGSDDTTLRAEAKYSIDVTQSEPRCPYIIMEAAVSYLLMVKNKSIQSKRLRNKTVSIVFRQYFNRFYYQ